MGDRPACIRCGLMKDVGSADGGRWYCHHCKVLFDDDPDEGGDHSSYDPAWRLEKAERTGQRRKWRDVRR